MPHPTPIKAALACAIVAISLSASGCRRAITPHETILAFAEAVQGRDYDRLYCLSAGAATAEELGQDDAQRRETFTAWAETQYDHYEVGRDEGEVVLDGQGIPLVKLLALGRGTYADLRPPRVLDSDTRVVRGDLRFGYDQIDLSLYSPGTTLYFNGAPVGRVQALEIPRVYREVTLHVLETVSVEWTLVRQDPSVGCEAGWAVASVEPMDDTARAATLGWAF